MSLVTRDLLGDHSSCKQLPLPDSKRCRSPKTWLSSEETDRANNYQTLQDLNKQPESRKPLNMFEDTNLDLKLVSNSSSSPPYTLGKVQFALEKAKKDQYYSNKRLKETKVDDEAYAAGCPSCLLYVIVIKTNPKCPRCKTTIPCPLTSKKPRIDLNITI